MNDAYAREAAEVLAQLNVSPHQGLSSEEAEHRLHQYGVNELREEKPVPAARLFLRQFNSPLIWILIAAVLISAFLREAVDALVIAAIIIINAILGFIQEYKAERAIAALKRLTASHSAVLRNGQLIEIESRNVVPGDILALETGDKAAADARLIEAHHLQTQEAVLTGESTPVGKDSKAAPQSAALADRASMLYAGTIITRGRAKAVVTATGMATEFGRIGGLQKEVQEPTPLQKRFAQLAKWMSAAAVIIIILTFSLGALRGEPLLMMFLVAVSLAVAAVPEGLPAVVTIALAVGTQRMIKRHALLRNLASAETLGSVSVICTDKTGTLTHNEMTVRRVLVDGMIIDVSGSGYSPTGVFSQGGRELDTQKHPSLQLLLKIGMLCNDARIHEENGQRSVIGDPTEGALLVSAGKAGLSHDQLSAQYPRIDELEFTSERKRMTTLHETRSQRVAFSKGAPDVLLERCDRILLHGRAERLTRERKQQILQANEQFAREALRVIAFAYAEAGQGALRTAELENEMIFIGLQAMIDPPRPEVKDSIAKCKSAGIRVLMITGDHQTTALAVAREIGIEGTAITGQELEKLSAEELRSRIGQIGIFARVDPEHKLTIIDALQARGLTVAMTGDGVNDAPALKKADIGVAMGVTGTDISREASDMVLTDDNFTSIVDAVEEGRGVYDNIKKFFAFLISGNLGEIGVIFGAMLIGLPLPLSASMILMINLVTDMLPALALGVDPFEPGAMTRKPREQKEPITAGLEPFIIWYPVILIVATLALFTYTYRQSGNLAHAQTVAFLSLALFELFQAFASRSTRFPALRVGLFRNFSLILAVLLSLAICVAIITIPALRAIFQTHALSGAEFLLVAIVASSGFFYLELAKYLRSRRTEA